MTAEPYLTITQIETKSEGPTPKLRWVMRTDNATYQATVLQQLWEVRTMDGWGNTKDYRQEWRDVPAEEETK